MKVNLIGAAVMSGHPSASARWFVDPYGKILEFKFYVVEVEPLAAAP